MDDPKVKLTKHDLEVLQQGAKHPDGVMRPMQKSNFDAVGKRMARLVRFGYATPNAHGDWYITDEGKKVVE